MNRSTATATNRERPAGSASDHQAVAARSAPGPGNGGWRALLARLRRRLRLVWASAFVQWVAPAVAVSALAVVAVGWIAPVPSPDRFVAGAVVFATLGIVVVALTRTIPTPIVARAADRWLGTGDAFITAHELDRDHPPDAGPAPLADAVEQRARRWATGVRAGDVVQVRMQPRRLAVAGAAGAAALILGFVPGPQDDARAKAEARKAALADEAESLRKAADELRRPASGAPVSLPAEQVAQQLDDLADSLQRTSSLEKAREALDKTQAELAAAIDPGQLTAKTAARGLERSLQGRPLTGTTAGSASEQLRAAAGALDALSPQERAAMAERLEELAKAQRAGNRAAADALQRAAEALRNGDAAAAARELQAAARAQDQAAERAAASDAAARAGEQVAQARQRVEDADRATDGTAQPSDDTGEDGGESSDPGSSSEADASGARVVSPQAAGQPSEAGEPGDQSGASNRQADNEGAKPGDGAGQSGAPQPGAAGKAGSSPGQGQAEAQGSDGEGQGEGRGEGEGQGAGKGTGQGQEGESAGEGDGQGQGTGDGQGQGPGQGLARGRVGGAPNGPSGPVAGAVDNGQTREGQGGAGTANGSGSQPTDEGVSTGEGARIYDPPNVERLSVTSPENGGPTQSIGKADGPTRDGRIAVPLSDALPRYEAQAVAASRSASLTPSERNLVRAYFDRLARAASGRPADDSPGATTP